MDVYVCADMEGVAGVVTREQLFPTGFEYELARRWMTEEVTAAVRGARSAGAERVVVSDSHGNGQNLLLDSLLPDIEVVRSWPRPLDMMQGINDGSFGAALFIGHHAGATDFAGSLAHTIAGKVVAELILNGTVTSESRLNAAIAGAFAVPVALITGDEAFIAVTRSFLPQAEAVVTKYCYTSSCCKTLTPARSCALIEAAAERAIRVARNIPPYIIEGPIQVEITFLHRAPAELLSFWPGVSRVASHRIRFEAKDVLEATRMVVVATSYDPQSAN